jgi:hypothetical protein
MFWYLQSLSDDDTHRGTLSRGSVNAVCGIRFRPRTVAFGRKALPGPPVDRAQICPQCDHAKDAR